MKPKVTVIIPAYNEEAVIGDCLQGLIEQDFQSFEVVVVDDGSTDHTREIIQGYSKQYLDKIRLEEFGKVGPGKARNLVAYRSLADILAFTDADCIPTPNWLDELLEGFQTDSVGSTGGPHLAPRNSNRFQQQLERFFRWMSPSIGFYKSQKDKIVEVEHNPLCNVAYRRDLFVRLRGFREDLFPGEDVDMDMRVQHEGFRINYNPRAVVYHHRPKDIQEFRKVMHAYGRAQGKLVREKGIRRTIQALGILAMAALLAIFWGLSYSFGWIGFGSGGVLVLSAFFVRPNWNNYVGIFLNAAQWFNGFIEGFWKKRSDPPGSRKP